MRKRTTIEIDEQLLARAKSALGSPTATSTVEQALRIAAEQGEETIAERAARQSSYLRSLSKRGDSSVLASDEMWR